jgi:hypothetical protein
MGMISMPQMIGPVYAQSDRASERACPVEGYTLSQGECTADPIIQESKCEPSTLNGVPVRQVGDTCTATARPGQITQEVCDSVNGMLTRDPKSVTCTFDATPTTITCPGGVPPTEERECITKPGQGNSPI